MLRKHCTASVSEGWRMVTDAPASGFGALRQRLLNSWWFAFLTVIILYTLCSGYSDFVNQVFITQYRYGYPAFLAFCQVLLTFLVLKGIRHVRWILIHPYSLERGELLLIPSICFSFHSVLSLWAVSSAHFSPFTFIRRFTPLASLVLVHVYPVKQRPPPAVSVIVVLVTLCSVIPGIQNFHDDVIVLVYGLFSLAFESLYLTSVQIIGEEKNMSAIDLHYTCVINSGPILALLCILHPDTPKALSTGSWHSLIFLGFFALMLTLGSILKFIVCFCAWNSSAVTVGIVDVAKTDIMILRNLCLFGWSSLYSSVITSFFISVGGVGVYVHKSYKARQYMLSKSNGIIA